MAPSRPPGRRWAGLALLWGLGPVAAWAGVPFSLPPTEDPGAWRSALALAASLDPSAPRTSTGPSVEIQETARPATWRLRVRDTAGVLHEVEVVRPSDAQGREDIVALAASLLRPLGGAGSTFGPRPITPPPKPVADPPEVARKPPPARAAPPGAPPGPEAVTPVPPPASLSDAPFPATVAGEAGSPGGPEPFPVPEALPEPERLPAPSAVATPLPPPAHPWMSAGGSLDLRADTGTSFGGDVLAGVAFRNGIHTGIGAAYGTPHDLADLARAKGAAYQDMDVYGALWWAPPARLAPLLGLRAGGTWRTFWIGDEREEITYDDGSAGVAAVVLVVALDAGIALRVVSGLTLVPALRLRGDVPGLGSSGLAPPSCIRWSGSDPSACGEGEGSYLSSMSLGLTLSIVVDPGEGDRDGLVAARQRR